MKGDVMTNNLLIPTLACALSLGMPLAALATCDIGTGNTRDGNSIAVWARNQDDSEDWKWITKGSKVELSEKYQKIDKYTVVGDKQENHFDFSNGTFTYRCSIRASRKSEGGNSAGGTTRINWVRCSLHSGDTDTAPPAPECSRNYKQDGGNEFRVNFSFEKQAASTQIHTSHGEFQSGSSDESSRHPRQ